MSKEHTVEEMPKWKILSFNITVWQFILISTAVLTIHTATSGESASLNTSTDKTVFYSFVDNITQGFAIGNVKRDSKLSSNYSREQLDNAHFTFLQMTNHKKDYQAYFKLRDTTGLLKAVAYIDRDELCPGLKNCVIKLDIAFRLLAKDFGVIRVIITLEDYNDNPPFFEDNHLEYSISESVPPGVILNIQPATDLDSPANGIDHYTLITADQDIFRLQAIKTNYDSFELKILLLTQLDREYQFRHEFLLIAHDAGQPSLCGNITMVLNVKDVNDNSPKFINPSLAVKVIEGTPRGAVLIHLHAMDLDSGMNGKIMYSFTNKTELDYGHLFRIKSKTGKIILKRSLDYEQKHSYNLDIVAKDLGLNSIPAEAKVIVNVIDVNDNAPHISVQPQYEEKLFVIENTNPNTFVAHISAHDEDSNQGGKVTCSMDDLSYEFFSLVKSYDGEYKLVTRMLLDREEEDIYFINITCTDEGTPPQSSSVIKQVIITDVNDHVPQFEKDVYECVVFENNPPHTSLIQISAKEPDSGVNGLITYKLGADAGKAFVINESSGLIEAMAPLDRELIGDVMNFHVLAIDKAIMPQTSTATIRLNILDQDDERPTFSQKKYMFSVLENIKQITSIGFVYAKDLDKEENGKFSFYVKLNQTDMNFFSINPESGEIFAKKPFDRETKTYHNVYVTVQSNTNSNFYDTCLVQVLIGDKNDNAPNITFPSINNNKVYIDNEQKIASTVTTIKAKDSDEGLNGKLTYYFLKKNEEVPFMIDEYTGTIYLTGDVSVYVHKQFPVEVTVRDRGGPSLHATAVVNLIVTNKLSQDNAWDETRQMRDSGMSMAVRVVIVCVVVGFAIFAIIGLSLFIRFIVIKTNLGHGDFFNLSWPITLNNNGHIPNSLVGMLPNGKHGNDSTFEETDTEQNHYILKRHRYSSHSVSSCPDISGTKESSQPFLPMHRDTINISTKLYDRGKFIADPPPTYTSSVSSQSTENLNYKKYKQRRRCSIPHSPMVEEDIQSTLQKCKTRAVYFKSDLNISQTSNEQCNKSVALYKYANHVSVMKKSPMTSSANVSFKCDSIKSLNEPIKIKTMGDYPLKTKSLNPCLRTKASNIPNTVHMQIPDLQLGARNAKVKEAYPDLLQHRKSKHSGHFQLGSRRLRNNPYTDPWDNIHQQQGQLKHSIPGHCTIIASESNISTLLCDDLDLSKNGMFTSNNTGAHAVRSIHNDAYHQRRERNPLKTKLSISTPTGLNVYPNDRSVTRYKPPTNNKAKYGYIPVKGTTPVHSGHHSNTQSGQNINYKLQKDTNGDNDVRRLHTNSLRGKLNTSKEAINMLSSRQRFVPNPNLVCNSGHNGIKNRNTFKGYKNCQGQQPGQYDSDGSYI